MRNLNFSKLVLIFVLLTVFLAACDKDDSSVQLNPTINFIQDSGYTWQDSTLLVGETMKIGIQATSQSDVVLTNFNYTITSDLGTVSVDSGIYTQDFLYEKIISKSFAETENWTFTIRDKDGRPASLSLNLFKADSSAWNEILYVGNIILGAQNSTEYGSFFSWEFLTNYSVNTAFQSQASTHLLYYYDFIDTDENTISSPGANIDPSVYSADEGPHNWVDRNTSRFVLTDLSEQEFISCDNDSLILANNFEFNAGKRKAKNLKAGDVYAFNDNNKKGLFLVHEVVGTDEGYVEFSIKMQSIGK